MSPGVYDSGRLLFMRDEKIFAQPFDPASLTLSGDPELVADGVWTDGQGIAGLVGFDARGGALGWRAATTRRAHIAWRNRAGTVVEDLQTGEAVGGVPSRDGRLIILSQPDYQMNTLGHVVLDPATGSTTSLTAPDTTSTDPIWSPDSRRVVYAMLRDGAFDLYIKEVRPGGIERLLLHTDSMKAAQSWSADGKIILFNANSPQSGIDLWAIESRPGAPPRLFAGGPGDQCCGRFSPDGAWIAYVSNESGRPEVFVRPSAGNAEPIRISSEGGGAPDWHTGSRFLHYLNPENRVMSVPITLTADTFKAGTPVPLFAINASVKPGVVLRATETSPYFSVGDRFLVSEQEADPRASIINLLVNWTVPPRR
jgi:serine/threonine-protein kinase